MELFPYLIQALAPMNLLTVLLGTVVGIVIGALPGFTATMGIAILIPVTYTWNTATALIFLGAIYSGSMFGGSISAILINTPGTAAAAATAIDGFEMTKQGKAHEALTEAAIASFWGGIASTVALLFFAPALAKWAFDFGAQEKFLMAVFGLTIIASLSTADIVKGLMMGCVGLLIGCVGMDPVTGSARFIFGSTYLLGGATMLPAVIGLFSISQVFRTLKDDLTPADPEAIARYRASRISFQDLIRYPAAYIRSSIIGIIIGIIPGTGGDVSSYVAYNMGKIFSRDKGSFGKGSRDGIAEQAVKGQAALFDGDGRDQAGMNSHRYQKFLISSDSRISYLSLRKSSTARLTGFSTRIWLMRSSATRQVMTFVVLAGFIRWKAFFA